MSRPATPPAERILARTVAEERGHSSPCWCWQGSVNHRGYGQTSVSQDGRTLSRKVHRIVYEALVGPIPDGLTLDHLCEVKVCVNPAHLEPTTRLENHLRYYDRRPRDRCRNGHAWAENRYYGPDGKSYCRSCNLAAAQRYQRRKQSSEVSMLSPRSGDMK